MEHIVQFAIGIDDEAITKTVKESAESQIIAAIKKDVEKIMFTRLPFSYGGDVDKSCPQEWVRNMVKSVIEDNKDQIIEGAISELAKNMARTKVVKEAIANYANQD